MWHMWHRLKSLVKEKTRKGKGTCKWDWGGSYALFLADSECEGWNQKWNEIAGKTEASQRFDQHKGNK